MRRACRVISAAFSYCPCAAKSVPKLLHQLECLGEVLAGRPELGESRVVAAHCLVAHGKIRIKFDSTLIVMQRYGSAFLAFCLSTEAERLQCFERSIKFQYRNQ